MIKILFVCLGNICRSPMAEFVMKDLVEKKHLTTEFYITSAATSSEEIGNPVHHGTRNKLKELGISTAGKLAVQLKKKDYGNYDYILGMEQRNITGIMRIVGSDQKGKVKRLLDYGLNPRDIADPWYTGDFDVTYNDVKEGCEALLDFILKSEGYN
ncbi:low molecular weight protein-tyrosine-phosphatase [Lacrimispora sp.]|uniref:low molecular weight protein-tyrosine-phosphatase n=1 Tax=Lacrimispora sp. TaxID=2719234 RepID=UPI0032E4C8FD